MTTENEVVEPVEGGEPEVLDTPELSDAELQATDLGWKPEEDFKADPKNAGKKWRPAEEFLDRKPLFDKLDDQNKRIKNLEKALNSIAAQSQRAEEIGRKKALEDLRAQKKEALENSDHDLVVAIDDKIMDIKQEAKQAPVTQQGPAPEFVEWVEKNQWYTEDPRKRAVADGIGLSLAKEGVPPSEVLILVEKEIKKLYKEDFEPKARPRAPQNSVDSGSRKTTTGNGADTVKSRMSGDELRIMKVILGTGLTEAEYLKQFVETQPERFKGVKLS